MWEELSWPRQGQQQGRLPWLTQEEMRGQAGSGGPLEVAQGRKRKIPWGRDRTSQQSAYHLSNIPGREVGSVSSLMGTGHDCRNLSVLGRHLGCSPLSLVSCSCIPGWMWIRLWIPLTRSRTQRAFKLGALSLTLKTPHSLFLWTLSLSTSGALPHNGLVNGSYGFVIYSVAGFEPFP